MVKCSHWPRLTIFGDFWLVLLWFRADFCAWSLCHSKPDIYSRERVCFLAHKLFESQTPICFENTRPELNWNAERELRPTTCLFSRTSALARPISISIFFIVISDILMSRLSGDGGDETCLSISRAPSLASDFFFIDLVPATRKRTKLRREAVCMFEAIFIVLLLFKHVW